MAGPRLEQVRKLIEAGRYDVARSVLRKIDDPVARSWLKKLNNAAPRKKKRASINWMLPALVVGVSMGVVIMILVLQYLPRFLEKSRQPEYPNEFGFSLEEEQYAQLVHYCTQSTGYGGSELCLDWADLIMTEYRTQTTRCLATAYAETETGFANFATCLAQFGLPNFFGQ